jgi:hypothetical protein
MTCDPKINLFKIGKHHDNFLYVINARLLWNKYTVKLVQSDILWHLTKIYVPKVFLLTKIKPEYSDILYNPTHFPGPLVC